MKHLLLFVCGHLLAAMVNAQTPTYQWAKKIGSTGDEHAQSVKIDGSGNVYITCSYMGTVDFDPGAGTYNLTSAGGVDICVTKLSSTGNFVWAKSIGGTFDEGGKSTIDGSGNVYIVGRFLGTADFDPGTGTANLTSVGDTDIFVCKLNASGNFIWAKRMGGTTADAPWNLAVDGSGNVYTTGYYTGTADFDPGTGTSNLTSAGNWDIFVSKLDASGNFVWVKGLGGSSQDLGKDIATDALGNVYSTGFLKGSADFDPNPSSSYILTSAGGSDIYVSKLDSSGNFVWAKAMGGVEDNQATQGMVLDGSGNVYTVGGFNGTVDFDPSSSSTYTLTAAGGSDVFVSKLDATGNFIWAKRLGGTELDWGFDIEIDGVGNVYTTGYFLATADFDPGPATYNISSLRGTYAMFLSKLNPNGNFIWAQAYGNATMATKTFALSLDASGNIFATGSFSGTTDFDLSSKKANLTSAGGFDIFVLKLSQPTGSFKKSTDTHEEIQTPGFSIYPNPNSGIFNVIVPKAEEKSIIEIYNQLGEIIYRYEDVDEFYSIDLTNNSNGLYFLRVTNQNNIIAEQKIIKQ